MNNLLGIAHFLRPAYRRSKELNPGYPPMLSHLYRFVTRLRYPVCCPEDIAQALGGTLSNHLSFDELVAKLTDPSYCACNLEKYMTRSLAEEAFANAQLIENFPHCTLISYYFNEGWMEFSLQFDDDKRLRRIYLQHQYIPSAQGVEIALRPKACVQLKQAFELV